MIAPSVFDELPPFPLDVLPEAAQGYCEFLAEGGIPAEYLGPSALAIMATAIGGLVTLQIGEGYWDEPLQIWTLTVGETGSGKSPAVKNLRRALDAIEVPWRRQHAEALEQWQLLPKKEREATPKPLAKRMVLADVTYEKTVRLLADEPNHAGLLLIADEFASFVRGLNQYKNGAGADRANFLTIWTSQPLSYDRVTEGISLFVEHPVVNILGGTQPHLLGVLTGDDGFRDRFLISLYEHPLRDEPDMPSDRGQAERWALLLSRLVAERDRQRVRFLSPEGLEAWRACRALYTRIRNDPETPKHLVNWTAKAASHLARLALLLAEADGSSDVGSKHIERASRLVNYFGAHYRRLPLEEPNLMLPPYRRHEDSAVAAIADFCKKCPEKKASRRQLQQAHVGGIRTSQELDAALDRYGQTYENHVVTEVRINAGIPTIWVYAPKHAPHAGDDGEEGGSVARIRVVRQQ